MTSGGAGTLVLCLGNDLRQDDAVGWRIFERLDEDPPPGADVCRSGASGFYLLDELSGYKHAIVVDAVCTGRHAPGDVFLFPVAAFDGPQGPSPHSVGLPTVLRVARQSGVPLPATIDVVAIEIADVDTLGADLTPMVRAAVAVAESHVRALVRARARVAADP